MSADALVLKVGDTAPDFALADADMHLRTLADYLDRKLVLYFYPRDDTPGCTLQADEFSEMLGRFFRVGARVVAVSPDDCFSHQAFRDKVGIKFPLLADTDLEACSSYGVLQDKEKNGIVRTTVVRSTFVIDRERVIRYARYGVAPAKHAREMYEVVRAMHETPSA